MRYPVSFTFDSRHVLFRILGAFLLVLFVVYGVGADVTGEAKPESSWQGANGSGAGAEPESVDVKMSKQPIEMVVSMLAGSAHKTILLGESAKGREVTVFYEKLPVEEAIRALAAAQRLCIVERNGSLILVDRQEYLKTYAPIEIIPLKQTNPQAMVDVLTKSATGGADGAIVISCDPRTRSLILKGDTDLTSPVKMMALKLDASLASETFSIRYASVTAIAKTMQDVLCMGAAGGTGSPTSPLLGSIISDERTNRVIVREIPENLARCRAIVERFDIPVETRVFATGVLDPKAIAEQIRKGELGAPDGKDAGGGTTSRRRSEPEATVQVVEGTNQIIVTDTPERLAILDKVMKELNQNVQTRVFQPRKAIPTDMIEVLTKAFPNIVSTVDSRTGSIVVTAHRDRLEQIDELLNKLDKEENIDVEIEAKIMLVAADKVRQLGARIYGQDLGGLNESLVNGKINPNFPADASKPIGSALGNPSGGSITNPVKTSGNYLEVLQPNVEVQAVIRALESDSDTTILATPRLRMLSGKTSSIFSGSREPYKKTTFQNEQAIEDVQFEKVGLNFQVSPFVSPDHLMTIDVTTDFSSLREVRDGIPVIDTRNAQSTVEARDGETILLGGLITKEAGKDHAGIPVLRSIPLVGYVFGAKGKHSYERELVIVITPRILTKGQVEKATLENAIGKDFERVRREIAKPQENGKSGGE
jgi:type II secretory pathway component GspD/PulD (secretin)